MTGRLMECITNPVKCKLLLEIHSKGKATAKQLADIYTDIPQATLYRHLKKMLSDGILQVVEETQVRGTVEKTYSLAHNLISDIETIVEKNSGELYMQYFMQYFIGFAKQFQEYCHSPNINIKKDMTGFSLSSKGIISNNVFIVFPPVFYRFNNIITMIRHITSSAI